MAKTSYERVREWRKRNPGKRAEEARRYRAKYPDKVKATIDRYRARHRDRIRIRDAASQMRMRRKDPEGNRRRVARFKERKQLEREIIAGRPKPPVCELCNEFNLRIVFDHCHQTGKFRGWLCDRCNKVLGIVKDSGPLLRKLADYVDHGEANGRSKKEDTYEGLCWT